MRANKVIPKGKQRFALLVDGQCEFWYFQMIKRNNRELLVDLKPEIPQKKKLSDQFNKILEYAKDYDKVIWIIDLDVITAETKKAKKGSKTAMQEFKEYNEVLKQHENVTIVINNPCLEFWLLLHFEDTRKFFNDCEKALKRLKKYLPDYEKTEKYYTKQNKDIYLRLKPHLETAIKNSEKLGEFSFDNLEIGISQMYRLFTMEELKNISKK